MKKHIFLFFFFLFVHESFAQSSFGSEVDVISYMEGKKFYSSSSGLELEYGYISNYNTYGIKVLNKNGARFYFINVNIDVYGSSADLYGMSPDTGSNFGFRLFRGKLVVGYGDPNAETFYLK
jgi:hypothetical protein